MTVQDIYHIIHQYADFSTQESWDNSGFLVGDGDQSVSRVGVSLDITREVLEAAREKKLDLLVSHHPVIFKAQKSFHSGEPAYELAADGISAICAHTSFDAAKGGVTDALARQVGFPGARALAGEPELSCLRVAALEKPISSLALARLVKEALGAKAVRCTTTERPVSTVAFCGGAGASFWREAARVGADALVTGDCGYHDFLDAEEAGFTIIAAGHFQTEQPGVRRLAQLLEMAFPSLTVELLPQVCPILDL